MRSPPASHDRRGARRAERLASPAALGHEAAGLDGRRKESVRGRGVRQGATDRQVSPEQAQTLAECARLREELIATGLVRRLPRLRGEKR